jgi:DNA-binding transcriptional LysR family regulator
LTDSTLKARRLLRANRVVCAAPSYWKTRGVPQRLQDLANHNCLVQARPDAPFATWTFLMDGQPMSVRARGDRVSNESQALKDWAIAGRGILRRGAWGIREELRTGALVTARSSYSVSASNLYAVTNSGMLSQRVRTFIDFLSGQLLESDPGAH